MRGLLLVDKEENTARGKRAGTVPEQGGVCQELADVIVDIAGSSLGALVIPDLDVTRGGREVARRGMAGEVVQGVPFPYPLVRQWSLLLDHEVQDAGEQDPALAGEISREHFLHRSQ